MHTDRKLAYQLLQLAALATWVLATWSPSTALATTGTMTINTSGTKTLTADHTGTIIVAANWVTLDCNGHTISNSTLAVCASSTQRCGIEIRGQFADVKNCTISGHTIGINVTSTAFNPWIYDNSIATNTEGITVRGATSPYMFGNVMIFNDAGVQVRDAGDFVFDTNDLLFSSGDGLDVNFTSGMRIDNNTIWGNGDHNVEIDDSLSVNAEGNEMDGQTTFFGAVFNTLSDNFQVERTSNIQVHDNAAVQSGRYGFYIRNVTNGSVTGNTASGNADRDCRERDTTGVSYSGNSFPTNQNCN